MKMNALTELSDASKEGKECNCFQWSDFREIVDIGLRARIQTIKNSNVVVLIRFITADVNSIFKNSIG